MGLAALRSWVLLFVSKARHTLTSKTFQVALNNFIEQYYIYMLLYQITLKYECLSTSSQKE